MLYIQKEFAQRLQPYLQNFKVKSQTPFEANFRCPFCGDSKKSRKKARGWIYEDNGKLFYKCFNGGCDIALSFENFLKSQSKDLYEEYIMELLKNGFIERKTKKESKQKKKIVKNEEVLKKMHDIIMKNLVPAEQNSMAKQYISSRKIPNWQWNRLYHIDNFYHWINTLIPGKFSQTMLEKDEPRLVIPFFDENGYVFGVQGRVYTKNEPRYITIMFRKHPKIFGLDKVDFSKKVYVVEGPIDSLFINNCLAFAGSSGELPISKINKEAFTVIFDNEPRNKEIVKAMVKYAENGYPICIWPSYITQKDINDMILSGISIKDLKTIIDNNTYSGPEAIIKVVEWKKTKIF